MSAATTIVASPLATRRRRRSAALLGLAALAAAVIGQGFIAGRAYIYDGLLFYAIALILGLRALDAARRPADATADAAAAAAPGLARGLATLRPGLLLAALVLAGILVSLRLFGGRGDLNLAWALYAFTVVAAPLAVWLLSGRPRLRPLADWSRSDLAALGAALAVGLAFRLFRIDSMPPGLWWDEGFSGAEVLKILRDPTYRPVYVAGMAQEPSLLWYTMIPFFWLFGPTALGVRGTALLGGTLGVLATYLLGREILGRRVGIVAAAVIAVLTWHVNFSRIGFNAIWSVTLDALATYFLVQALRTRRLLTFALAGTTLGLAANMYYTSRLMPVILGLYLLHRLATGRAAFVRQNLVGLAVFLGVLLLTLAPLAQYAVLYPREFGSRMDQASIFKEVAERQSYAPVVENLRKHLLMFHYAGDPNGRHNLPGAPLLDQAVGGLFVLGLALALRRLRRPECFLLVVWVPTMLVGGVLSLSFEAPQALRTIDEITAVALLAALPIAGAWGRLDELRLGTLDLGTLRLRPLAGRRLTLSVAALLVVALLAWVGFLNYRRYFVEQARDFAVWNAFSTAETEIARMVNELGESYRVYLGETALGKPTIYFLTQRARFEKFDAAGNVPLRDQSNVALFIEPDQERTLAMLRRLYPGGRFGDYRSPYGGPAVMLWAIIPQPQIEALQGLAASYFAGPDWSGEPTPGPRLGAVDLDWGRQPPRPTPFAAELRSTLIAPLFGRYQLKLEAPAESELLLDETTLLKGGEEKMVVLAKGTHALRLRAALREPAPLRLLWRPPNGAGLVPVPREVYFAPPVRSNGLLGSYYANREWAGQPAIQQIDPSLDIRFHILPLSRPYSVEWKGKIDVPREGSYRFAVESADTSWLYVDEQLVATNEGAPRQLREGIVRLSEGFHDIRVRYFDASDHTFIRAYWTPPGGQRQVIPFERLFPPQGAYRERAVELAPAPLVAPAQPAAPAPAKPAAAPPPAVGGVGKVGPLAAAAYAVALQMGEPGAGPGQLSSPRGVAVDAQGNVYVADTGNSRIQKFDRAGQPVIAWGKKGEGDAEFADPVALAIDGEGNVVVLDAEHGWIKRFSPDGRFLAKYGGPAGAFYHPRGLALDAQGNIYIADTGTSRVVKFSPTGELLGRFGEKGSGPGQLVEPTDVAVAPDGSYYVADSANSKVVWFDASWQPQAEWSIPRAGSVFGPHLLPLGPAGVLVADPEGKRVVRYSANGQPLDQVSFDGLLERPLQLALDAERNLYVADSGSNKVLKLSPGQ